MKSEQIELLTPNHITLDVLIGQNAQENWDLIDNSDNDDIWFHLDDMPSSHVVLKLNGLNIKDLPKQVIYKAAVACKKNSKAKSLNSVNVIYTFIKNVTKAETVGSVNTSNTKIIKV
jgi:predicted ribosome quality control (RQC) complex YloA/Tae2 family protein